MIPDDADHTLTSRLSSLGAVEGRMLALTIQWHPQAHRIGEQFIAGPGVADIALNRYAPLFARPGHALLPLGERCIARDSLLIRRDAADGLAIDAPQSRMSVDIDGVPLQHTAQMTAQQVAAGVTLVLGGAVVLCVHWMEGLPRPREGGALLGVSSAMRKVHAQIRQVAPTALPVLLLGETGTGKELAAQAIHAASPRAGRPLVAVNMAALNESLAAADLFGAVRGAYTGALAARAGLFEEASDSSLFLDEIGNAPVQIQPMLLRVLETGEYRALGAASPSRSSARLIAATDQDLQDAAFNQPLLRRLEAFVIALPALRERREDIGVIVADMAARWNAATQDKVTLPAELVAAMCRHDWPGNVRQLGNAVKRALIALQAGEAPAFRELVPQAALPTLAAAPPPGTPAGEAPARRARLSDLDNEAVLAAMEANGWRISHAASALGISRPSMYKLLEGHPQIRFAETIPVAELRGALAAHEQDVARCATALRTPSEGLRRHLRSQGLIP